jgi:hypothetical protein
MDVPDHLSDSDLHCFSPRFEVLTPLKAAALRPCLRSKKVERVGKTEEITCRRVLLVRSFQKVGQKKTTGRPDGRTDRPGFPPYSPWPNSKHICRAKMVSWVVNIKFNVGKNYNTLNLNIDQYANLNKKNSE